MKKKKLRFKKKTLIFLLLIVIFTGAIFYSKYHNNPNDSKIVNNIIKSNKLEKLGYKEDTISLINQKLAKEEIEDLEKAKFNKDLEIFIKEKYYLHKNLDKYITYYSTHNDLEISKVIALVNVRADEEGYKNPKPANLDKGILVIVNKYNVLEEGYEPDSMMDIPLSYAYEGRKIRQEVYDAYLKMYNAALKDNIKLFVTSAFRSYEYQSKLYSNYVGMYGADYANTVSAKPGFSEHQTGLALDILSPGVQMSEFKNTDAAKWLAKNSYKYGFILRYPEDKTDLTGYAYESWHFRYLDNDMAKKVFEEDITYDEYYAFYLDK